MTVLAVEPPGYATAARTVGGEIAGTLARLVDEPGYGLAGTGAMAGSDPIGSSWAAAYDSAALSRSERNKVRA